MKNTYLITLILMTASCNSTVVKHDIHNKEFVNLLNEEGYAANSSYILQQDALLVKRGLDVFYVREPGGLMPSVHAFERNSASYPDTLMVLDKGTEFFIKGYHRYYYPSVGNVIEPDAHFVRLGEKVPVILGYISERKDINGSNVVVPDDAFLILKE